MAFYPWSLFVMVVFLFGFVLFCSWENVDEIYSRVEKTGTVSRTHAAFRPMRSPEWSGNCAVHFQTLAAERFMSLVLKCAVKFLRWIPVYSPQTSYSPKLFSLPLMVSSSSHTHTLFSHTQSFTLTHSHIAILLWIFFSFHFFPINIFSFQIVCTI